MKSTGIVRKVDELGRNAKDIINYKGKNICPDCIRAMNEKL